MNKMEKFDEKSFEKADRINELIKKLASNDNKNDENLFKEVDKFLNEGDKIGFDKTLVNKFEKKSDELSKNCFMQEVEADAKERASKKAEARMKAEHFKTKANDYFKACDYKRAVDLYSKAIETCNDLEVLYTNRAQALIKMDLPKEALQDCDIALRLSEDNHKALLHKGKALVRLNRFDEALECYRHVLELAPKLNKYMQEFFEEAEKLKQMTKVKETSASVFEGTHLKGNETLELIVNKVLTKNKENVEFYAGGVQLLVEIVKNNDNYLDILRRNITISTELFDSDSQLQSVIRNIISKKYDNIKDEEWNLLTNWLDLLRLLVKNNEQFASSAITIPVFFEHLSFCLKSPEKIPSSLLLSATSILYYISSVNVGIQQIFDRFSLYNVLSLVIKALSASKQQGLCIVGIGLFRNLVESQRFKVALGKEEQLLITVIDCLHTLFLSTLSSNSEQLGSVISIIDLLSDNSAVRLRLIKHDKFLGDCMNTIEARLTLSSDSKHADILLKLFTFIHNLLLLTKNIPTSNKVKIIGQRVVESASALLANNPSMEMRSILIQVLSQMLAHLNDDQLLLWSQHKCEHEVTVDDDNVSMCRSLSRKSSLTDQNYLEKVCTTLKLCVAILDAPNHPLLSCAVKILTLVSKVSKAVLFLCCDVRERTLKLQSLIYREKEPLDEVLAGNICLLLINSVNDTPVAEHLSSSSVMRDLLRVCADAQKTDCKRNAAILAGKLAQSSHLHKNELSRLNGFNIIAKFNTWS